MKIRRAGLDHVRQAAYLTVLLWPHNHLEEMEQEMEELLRSEENAVFLAWDGEKAVGFVHCSLRHDYVEGANHSPTAYLEGIYVREDYRNHGLARQLLSACENWAKEMNCSQLASDCELSNSGSLVFHLKNGFAETNRIICFLKDL